LALGAGDSLVCAPHAIKLQQMNNTAEAQGSRSTTAALHVEKLDKRVTSFVQ
jgi:hypothetical protein